MIKKELMQFEKKLLNIKKTLMESDKSGIVLEESLEGKKVILGVLENISYNFSPFKKRNGIFLVIKTLEEK
jgi:hypothetical protein